MITLDVNDNSIPEGARQCLLGSLLLSTKLASWRHDVDP